MPGFTPYFANKVLDHCLNGVSWTPPTDVYMKLHVGDPGPDGSANPSTTTNREEVSFSAAVSGRITLTSDLTFDTQTEREAISHASLWDASSNGNCLVTFALDETKNLYVGDVFQLPSVSIELKPEA